MEAIKFAKEGYTIVLIGHEGHDEVLGTMGEAPGNMVLVEDASDVSKLELPADAKLAFLTQTTLSVDEARIVIDAIKAKYPQVVGPSKDDICYATQNRQTAVKDLARSSDLVLVIGSPTSSNANRLVEVARTSGARAHLIECAADIDAQWLGDAAVVGLTAGASTPEKLVQDTIDRLRTLGCSEVEDVETARENVTFTLPRELRTISLARGGAAREES
jgi:4-hydroxy-3-methylbut-2-enyl diphosphate reductase